MSEKNWYHHSPFCVINLNACDFFYMEFTREKYVIFSRFTDGFIIPIESFDREVDALNFLLKIYKSLKMDKSDEY